MRQIKVGIIGLGTIGRAVVKNLLKTRGHIKRSQGVDIVVAKICDKRKSLSKDFKGIPFVSDAWDVVNSDVDVVVELIGGVNPAFRIIKESLKKGKDVVTANKALLAEKGGLLLNLACGKNCGRLRFEASVCGGVPVIRSIYSHLSFAGIKSIIGILNGTTNYILSNMADLGGSFKETLEKAKKLGYAEQNPSLDIDGIDSLHKLSILSYLGFGKSLPLAKVFVEGIRNIDSLDIEYAKELGYVIKLLAVVRLLPGKKLEARVHPAFIPASHPLARVKGSFNAVFVDTERAGEFLFSGLGAGGDATSAAVIADIVSLGRESLQAHIASENKNVNLVGRGSFSFRYYLRFSAVDKPGVLAKISRVLADYGVSIASVTQKQRGGCKFVPIVMLTHNAQEIKLLKARSKIDSLSVIKPPTQVIRIEEI